MAEATFSGMTTGKGFLIYMSLLLAEFGFFLLAVSTGWFPGILAALSYLVCGFLLNRIVLRELVDWHPMYDTLHNVSSAKLGMLQLWPIRYPVLFFRLLAYKYL